MTQFGLVAKLPLLREAAAGGRGVGCRTRSYFMTSISLKISACGREIGRGIVVLGTLFFGSTAWSQNLQQFEDQPDTVPPHLNSPQMLNLPNIAWPKGDATMQPGWTADNPGRVPFLGAPNVNGSFDGLHSTQNGFHNPSFPYPSYPNPLRMFIAQCL